MQKAHVAGDREVKAEYFSATRLNEMRRKAQELQLDLPGKEGWHVSPVSPMEIVKIFPNVWIKEGFTLNAYIFRSGENGNGVVWALPEDSEFPEPDECNVSDDVLKTPEPPHAKPFYEVIDDDGSLQSYLSASILTRELFEFGALWHGCWWSYHEVIGGRRKEWNEFEWKRDVKSFRPKVIFDKNIAVEFFTYSEYLSRDVQLNRDIYTSNYIFDTEVEIVASSQGGFIP